MTNKESNAVKILTKGTAYLLEWRDEDGLHRGYVPPEVVEMVDGVATVPTAVLMAAAPYGDDLLSFVHEIAPVTARDVVEALHNAGLWTSRDMLNDAKQVRAVVASLNPVNAQQLLTNARRQ